MHVQVMDHPLIQHKITLMRKKKRGRKISATSWKKSPCSWAMKSRGTCRWKCSHRNAGRYDDGQADQR